MYHRRTHEIIILTKNLTFFSLSFKYKLHQFEVIISWVVKPWQPKKKRNEHGFFFWPKWAWILSEVLFIYSNFSSFISMRKKILARRKYTYTKIFIARSWGFFTMWYTLRINLQTFIIAFCIIFSFAAPDIIKQFLAPVTVRDHHISYTNDWLMS